MGISLANVVLGRKRMIDRVAADTGIEEFEEIFS
jgi:hypothetical protein